MISFHKLARLFYQIWKTAGQYSDPGMDYYEKKYQDLMLKNLQNKADALGLQLVPKPEDKKETPFSLKPLLHKPYAKCFKES